MRTVRRLGGVVQTEPEDRDPGVRVGRENDKIMFNASRETVTRERLAPLQRTLTALCELWVPCMIYMRKRTEAWQP